MGEGVKVKLSEFLKDKTLPVECVHEREGHIVIIGQCPKISRFGLTGKLYVADPVKFEGVAPAPVRVHDDDKVCEVPKPKIKLYQFAYTTKGNPHWKFSTYYYKDEETFRADYTTSVAKVIRIDNTMIEVEIE